MPQQIIVAVLVLVLSRPYTDYAADNKQFTSFGWIPAEAIIVAMHSKATCTMSLTVHPLSGFFDPRTGHTSYGLCPPFSKTADHEEQHTYHWLKTGRNYEGTISYIRRDWQQLAVESNPQYAEAAAVARLVTLLYPQDVIHWPHYQINYLGRRKSKLPPAIRDFWYGWLKDQYRTIIPLVSQPAAR